MTQKSQNSNLFQCSERKTFCMVKPKASKTFTVSTVSSSFTDPVHDMVSEKISLGVVTVVYQHFTFLAKRATVQPCHSGHFILPYFKSY